MTDIRMYDEPVDAGYVDRIVDGENVVLMRELIYVLWGAIVARGDTPPAPTCTEPHLDDACGHVYDDGSRCDKPRWHQHFPGIHSFQIWSGK